MILLCIINVISLEHFDALACFYHNQSKSFANDTANDCGKKNAQIIDNQIRKSL